MLFTNRAHGRWLHTAENKKLLFNLFGFPFGWFYKSSFTVTYSWAWPATCISRACVPGLGVSRLLSASCSLPPCYCLPALSILITKMMLLSLSICHTRKWAQCFCSLHLQAWHMASPQRKVCWCTLCRNVNYPCSSFFLHFMQCHCHINCMHFPCVFWKSNKFSTAGSAMVWLAKSNYFILKNLKYSLSINIIKKLPIILFETTSSFISLLFLMNLFRSICNHIVRWDYCNIYTEFINSLVELSNRILTNMPLTNTK